MMQVRKRILAMLLVGLMCVSLLPMAALADPGEGEGSIAPVEGEAGEERGVIASCEEVPGGEEDGAVCQVSFLRDPFDAAITVYDPAQYDESGEMMRIEPQEDGTWLLAWGVYCFSVGCPGYESVEKAPFSTEGKSKLTIDLTLVQIDPIPSDDMGESLLYEQAYPLPVMTGDRAADTANVAQSQLGYTMSGGTVYGAWWNEVTNWGYDYTYADWCAMFACWCAFQAGAGFGVAYDKYGANANFLMEWQIEHAFGDKSFSTNPKAGDFLFFGGSDGKAGHVAIVTSYDASARRVYFVGGNQGSPSSVSRGSVAWGKDSYWGAQVVLGYGRPNYAAGGTAPKAALDAAAGGAGVITVSGWAFDPDEPASPVTIQIYVGGQAGSGAKRYELEAKDYREDVDLQYPGAGYYHGFSKTIQVEERGTQTLYFYACDAEGSQPEILFAKADVSISMPMLILYTVSYDANGGVGAPSSQVKTHDTALTLSTVKPTRADESGKGLTVTLDPNGGTVSSYSLQAAQSKSFSFSKWNTAANGSGVSYAPGASYTANAGATLYAQWKSKTTTQAVTLPTPTRTGYLFLGWATDKDATSGTTGSYTPAANVTLYAIWEADPDFRAGDVNGDGKVDILDLVRLRRHLAGIQVELKKTCADLDGDGKITSTDLEQLRRLLVDADQ